MAFKIKSSNSEELLGSPWIVISHLKNMLIVAVKKLSKNYMRYLEYHNIYQNIRNEFCSKYL